MKITTFNPQIITKDTEKLVKLFQELGFEKRHDAQLNDGEKDVESIRMADPNGFHVDITEIDNIPRELTVIRMNGDNFDEACGILKKHGFKNFYDDKIADTPSSKSAVMISPTGYTINLVEHIKGHD